MTMTGAGLGAVTLTGEDRAAALGEVKALARIETNGEDEMLANLVDAALGLAEQFCGRALIARSFTVMLDARAGWHRLAITPVRAIAGVAGFDSDGAAVAVSPPAYELDLDAAGQGWIRIGDAGAARRLEVTVTAGLAPGWAALPAPLRQGIALLAGYLYAERDATLPPPAAITALWRPFRDIALLRAGRT